MKIVAISSLMVAVVLASSCATIDYEKRYIKDTPIPVVTIENKSHTVEVEPIKIAVEKLLVIPQDAAEIKKSGAEAIYAAMNEAMVTPQNYVGGTMQFDYDSNRQYPIVTRLLTLTLIKLEPGETTTGRPFLSDTINWEITGDIWPQKEGETQLVMIKPKVKGLLTTMIIVTNRRIYNFVLSSTGEYYMPMIQFRYPNDPVFITSTTRTNVAKNNVTMNESAGSEYISYNYIVRKPLFFAPRWVPERVYDDGEKTYIILPRVVLQDEYPAVFDGKRDLVQYRVIDNMIVIDKLVEKCTLRLGMKTVTIVKKRGAADERNMPVDMGTEPRVYNAIPTYQEVYKVRYNNFDPPAWMPKQVYDDGMYMFIIMPTKNINGDEMAVINEKNEVLQIEIKDGVIKVLGLYRRLRLAYAGDSIIVEKSATGR